VQRHTYGYLLSHRALPLSLTSSHFSSRYRQDALERMLSKLTPRRRPANGHSRTNRARCRITSLICPYDTINCLYLRPMTDISQLSLSHRTKKKQCREAEPPRSNSSVSGVHGNVAKHAGLHRRAQVCRGHGDLHIAVSSQHDSPLRELMCHM